MCLRSCADQHFLALAARQRGTDSSMTSKESSGKPYGLQKAKEDVKRLVVESNGHLLYDSFQSAFRDKYGSDLHPGHFGCMSLLQLLETKMKEIVKVSGGESRTFYTHCVRGLIRNT